MVYSLRYWQPREMSLKQEVLGRNNRLTFLSLRIIWYDTDRTENTASESSSVVGCVFVAARYLPSRCLAMLGTHRQQGDLISVLSFFQNNESSLKGRTLQISNWEVGPQILFLYVWDVWRDEESATSWWWWSRRRRKGGHSSRFNELIPLHATVYLSRKRSESRA
jgi:hypothetical protein